MDLDAPLSWASQFHFQDSANRYVELIALLYDDVFVNLIVIVLFVSYFLFTAIYCFTLNENLKFVPRRFRVSHDSVLEII